MNDVFGPRFISGIASHQKYPRKRYPIHANFDVELAELISSASVLKQGTICENYDGKSASAESSMVQVQLAA